MNWEMCFKRHMKRKSSLPSSVQGSGFGVGRAGGPCPTLLGPGSGSPLLRASVSPIRCG